MWCPNLSRCQGLGLAILRIWVGVLFFVHGYEKIFVHGIGAVADGFEKWNIPYPNISAALVGYSEFLGGAALALGLLTRLAVIPLAIIMIVAIWKVHWPNGFSNMKGGYEFQVTLLASHICLFMAGGGWLSADWILKKCCKRGNKEPASPETAPSAGAPPAGMPQAGMPPPTS